MPELNVDPQELLGVASALAGTAGTTGFSLPTGWVQHAGADPVSAAAVPFLNGQTESIFNGTLDTLNGIHQTAYKIGTSASNYTATDSEGGQIVGGSGGDILTNPVSSVSPLDFRQAPVSATGSGAVDPMTFAQQLHTGPGIGPATGFASSIRDYLGGVYATTVGQLGDAANILENWTTGASAAATEVAQHLNTLGQYGSHLSGLADNIDAYTDAFSTVKSRHPTPQEIQAARQELLAAMKGKDKVRLAKALAHYQEVMAQSQQAFTDYTSTVGSKLGSGSGTGTGKGSTGTSGTTTGTTGTGSGSGSSSSSSDISSLMQMLQSLMSSMGQGASGLQGLAGQKDQNADALGDSGLGSDYGSPIIPSSLDGGGGGGGGGSDFGGGGSADSVSVGTMPMVATTAGLNAQVASTAARTAVPDAAVATTAARSATAAGGSPYMPYMPMGGMGGAGGAGGSGGERNRVVAWHPDRLMYVDDTPFTEQVIGEKPTIAPTVTPPTTPGIGNQTQSGGNA
ncbi:PPE domain-containing protein [Nocardia sp. alder85J]|uniref:PPE domain-containing protein n=1 Tax=Nocardia sp. alder85J TaxID=2862949 RepID=UPI001CD40BD2|nr:PPE domain-containing protein [Nocardia sp. alder85J]MCX4092174.1 PPE domain-containing protein [Nocardia sp. alder85J]